MSTYCKHSDFLSCSRFSAVNVMSDENFDEELTTSFLPKVFSKEPNALNYLMLEAIFKQTQNNSAKLP